MSKILNLRENSITTLVTTSWLREDLSNGHKRFKVYAISVPILTDPSMNNGTFSVENTHPRLAGNPVVISESTLEAPNLEVAKLIHAGQAEMLRSQPPEIVQVSS